MTQEISRRAFLKGSAVLTLSLLQLRFGMPQAAHARSSSEHREGYHGWEDVYREKWTWDKVVNSTHHVANCASACPWVLYIKDGIVWREEQNAVLDSRASDLPDYNPRGCQKGACFSQLMYGPQRLKYPVKRVGPRGSGKWKRITWDEAYEEIADKMLEVIREDGPECIIHESGTANAGYGAATSGEMSFFDFLGATQLDGWATVGDMPLGVILTWGLFNTDSTADDYVRSDLIFMWLGNPSYTRIPEAHFFWEARYRGAKVVSVAPDYNASTMHADQWINLRVGTDAALALGMAKVIIDEGLYKADYVKEQTDLPILVRDDTRKFLRASDMEKGGKDNVFYLWDSRTGKAVRAPGSEGMGRTATLALGKLDPALEGSFEVTLADGERVRVRPVFELLKKRLQGYTPEKVEDITGVGADTIRELARETARAKAVNMYSSWGSMKHYHSDLFQRGIILLLALTGNVGYRGTGLKIGAWYMLSSIESAVSGVKPTWYQRLLLMLFKPTVREYIKYFREYEKDKMYVPALMFLYHHGGLNEVVDNPAYHDPNPGKALPDAVREAVDENHIPLFPRREKRPRLLVHTRVNPLRRWPAPQVIEKNLWPKCDLIVGVNLKMSATALKSDMVLPAAGYYERRGIKYAQSYVPYYMVGEQGVEPVGESRTEWKIWGDVARLLQEKARRVGIREVKDAHGKPRDYSKIFDRWSHNGEFDPDDDRRYYEIATGESPEMGYISWKEASDQGAVPIKGLGPFRTHTNICSDYEPEDSIYPCQWFVQHKQPWPTLTGRMQFYIDHPWFLDAGDELPVHKEAPRAGGDYPLRMTGGHTRWSIHSTWRDEPHMLQMQRGEPSLYISNLDAARRGVRDNDRVRVYNDVGSCEMLAKVSPAVQPGQLIIYHAWEPHQFKEWKSNQQPVPSPWKALHMTEYGQLHYRFLFAGPHHTPRGTTVEVERI